MARALSAIVVALVGGQAATGQSVPAAPPLQPSGPWVLEGGSGECLLQRTYPDATSDLTMALTSNPYGGELTLLIVGDGDLPLGARDGHVRLSPSSRGLETDVQGDRLSDGGIALRISVKGDESFTSDTLNDVQAMTVTVGDFSRTLALPGIAQAGKALVDCDRKLIKSWGLDPDERQHIAVVAKPASDMQHWITSYAYPRSAVARGRQGNTRILYTIGVDGRVFDCRVVISSGDKNLDAAGCRNVTAYARYEPAEDSQGRAIESHDAMMIYWRIGG